MSAQGAVAVLNRRLIEEAVDSERCARHVRATRNGSNGLKSTWERNARKDMLGA